MIEENINDRRLNDMVDVIVVYGLDTIKPNGKPDEAKKLKGKAEGLLRAFQGKFPNPPNNLRSEVINLFNEYKLDEEFDKILVKMPAAVELSKEYKSKPVDQ